MVRQPQDMPEEIFRRVIDELAEHDQYGALKAVGLHFFGEPLNDPRIFERIEYAAERLPNLLALKRRCDPMRGLSTSTNGVFITEENTDRILDSGLTGLGLSLDGATKDTYERMRYPAKFEDVVRNITCLLARNRERGGTGANLFLQVIETPTTRAELSELTEAWGPYVDGVPNVFMVTKPLVDFAGQVEYGGAGRDMSRFFVRVPCPSLFDTMVVTAEGEVTVCCYDVNAAMSRGSLTEQNLSALWHSPAYADIRRRHVRRDYRGLPLCEACRETKRTFAQLNPLKRLAARGGGA